MLSWFGGGDKAAAVGRLMAQREYDKAREVLEGQLRQDPDSVHLRQIYADVLVHLGEIDRAVGVLRSLVDRFASEGFVSKAIAVLKKIQRIEPRLAEVDERLATLLQQQHRGDGTSTPSSPSVPSPGASSGASSALPRSQDDPAHPTAEQKITGEWAEKAPENRDGFYISPLFSDFSRAELAAVVSGLTLLAKGPGSIILTEGESGDSFYILTTGVARVYRRNETGHNFQVATLRDGDFFGEAALLTGEPRSATITAATECELLVLDRGTFLSLVTRHPRVRDLIRELHAQRTGVES